MNRNSPRDYYGQLIKTAMFGDPYKGERSPAWIAEKLGVSVRTVYEWRKDPGRIPAYQYLRLMQICKD